MKDTCISEEKMLKDPRRLYAPGRLYHIVERKPFRYIIMEAYYADILLWKLTMQSCWYNFGCFFHIRANAGLFHEKIC